MKADDVSENSKKILFIDDSKDIGNAPLPIRNPDAQKVHDRLMKKYKKNLSQKEER